MWMVSHRFEVYDDEREVRLGAALLDYMAQPRERIGSLLARWRAGFAIGTTFVHHAACINVREYRFLLQPAREVMPTTRQYYNDMIFQLRHAGDILQRTPDYLAAALRPN